MNSVTTQYKNEVSGLCIEVETKTYTTKRGDVRMDWEHFYLNIEGQKKTIYLCFDTEEEVISEGYQIFYPVDKACDEPAEVEYHINIDYDSVLLIEKTEDDEIETEYSLPDDELNAIQNHLDSEYYEF